MNNPTFSVVIPLYNKAAYIADTIKSVLQQTFCDYEIIVVDDSSTDNGLEILSQFSDSRLNIYTKKNGGVSDARNCGIKKAKGKYIAFLDADDLWDKTYLENRIGMIKRFPGLAMYAGGYISFIDNINTQTTQIDLRRLNNEQEFVINNFFDYSVRAKRCICLTSAVVVRKCLLDDMDTPFPIGISRGEDVDLWTRLSLKHSMAYSNECLMRYRKFAMNSLNKAAYLNNVSEFDYTQWFDYNTDKKKYIAFVNMFLTLIANQSFIRKNYKNALKIKMCCRGNLFSPLFLMSVKILIFSNINKLLIK